MTSKTSEVKEKVGRQKCEVFTRTVGYIRPMSYMNDSKKQEVKDRKLFKL